MEQITASTEFEVMLIADNAGSLGGCVGYRRLGVSARPEGVVFEKIVILPAEHRGKRFNAERVKPEFRDWSAVRR